MNCKAFEEGLAALAEGKVDSEAERHVATCPACATRLEGLRRVVAAARTPIAAAPRDLVARAQDLLRPSTRRLVARLLGNGFAASGARGGEATDFSLHVGVEEVSIRLHYAPTKGVWEILGRAPGEEWSVGETPCGPSGRFRLVVPSLESAAFVLRGPGVEIEVPSAWELLDRDA